MPPTLFTSRLTSLPFTEALILVDGATSVYRGWGSVASVRPKRDKRWNLLDRWLAHSWCWHLRRNLWPTERFPSWRARHTIGVILALGTTRLLNKLLFGINPIDPLTFGLTCTLILGIALLASYVPALEASNITPVEALRQE